MDEFLKLKTPQLIKCYRPIDTNNSESKKRTDKLSNGIQVDKIDSKVRAEADTLSKAIKIDELCALEIVNWFDRKGIFKHEQRLVHYTRHYFSENRYLVKLVGQLFKLRSEGETELGGLARKYTVEILAHDSFFPNLLKHIEWALTTLIDPVDDDTLYSLAKTEVSTYHSSHYQANSFRPLSM